MFHSARIKLTAWYLLIIMLISMSFSMVIFRMMSLELDRMERIERTRSERFLPHDMPPLDPEVIQEVKDRIILMLIVINASILGASTIAGYFLAGKTLKPIKDMVDEQNRFITDASHELRTPITALKTSIEVALRDKKFTVEEGKEVLTGNLTHVENLEILSDGLIKLSQYQKQEDAVLMEPTSLSLAIQKAIEGVKRQATKKHITISFSPKKDVTLHAQKGALTELFTILLDNAVKYSPKGKPVRVTAEKTDGSVVVEVSDEGIGIDKKDIPHIFDRFYRADASRTKSSTNGYGLGLSIGKQIVERHHGTIHIKEHTPKGTTFVIKLPV